LTVQRCRTAFPGQIRLENAPKKRKLRKSYNIAFKTLKKNTGKNWFWQFQDTPPSLDLMTWFVRSIALVVAQAKTLLH
jgi:hypothetical protein